MFKALRFAFILALTGFFLAGCGVNNIPTFEEKAKSAWSQVLNQYKRRADLIPNLVETVKGFAAHEKDVLTSVVEARAKTTQTTIPADILNNPAAMQAFQQNQDALSSALSRLLVTIERYPDLKTSQNFVALQSQLKGSENRISVAHRDYIEVVRIYNTELKTIPGRWWAQFLYPQNKPMANFTVEAKDTEVPKVDFNNSSGSN